MRQIDFMKRQLLTVASLLLIASSILLQSCEKWDEPTNKTNPQIEQITQGFSMSIKDEVTPMTTKSWDPATWVYNYSTVPQTFTLTGTGSSAGTNYTKTGVTVAQLQAGTVSMTILPGTYTATFETPHVRTLDTFSNSPFSGTIRVGSAVVGDVLDIKINNPNLHLTGSPIALQATLEDALIIVDVPNVAYVFANKSATGTPSPNPFLLKDAVNGFHYGYVNETPLWLNFMAGTERNVDASGYLKGNAYQLVSAFGATTTLNIPNMILNYVVVP